MMDELTFKQEFEGSFVEFKGRAYYSFSVDRHGRVNVPYDPEAPLILCFDFNTAPGTATILQELPRLKAIDYLNDFRIFQSVTAIIGEVYIPRGSTTPLVCRTLAQKWGEHRGIVKVYGDATGGARKSSATEGNDWELVEKELRPVFGSRLQFRVPSSNPTERARVNAVNSRFLSVEGFVGMIVDMHKAPMTVKDFDGVRVVEGGPGDIDKKTDKMLTHLSDGVGYYVAQEFPTRPESGTYSQAV
jgi:hypothetical protein